LALGGCCFNNINNDKMEDCRQGRIGTCGEDGCPSFGVGILIYPKKREIGGPLALDGNCLVGEHNNQPKVGVGGGRDVSEETRPRRNAWVGVVSSYQAANCRGIKNQN
jgi:hypothetical protein